MNNQTACRSLDQIHAAIYIIKSSKTSTELNNAQNSALAFIQASFDDEKIDKSQKQALEKKVRQIYRQQIIEESL